MNFIWIIYNVQRNLVEISNWNFYNKRQIGGDLRNVLRALKWIYCYRLHFFVVAAVKKWKRTTEQVGWQKPSTCGWQVNGVFFFHFSPPSPPCSVDLSIISLSAFGYVRCVQTLPTRRVCLGGQNGEIVFWTALKLIESDFAVCYYSHIILKKGNKKRRFLSVELSPKAHCFGWNCPKRRNLITLFRGV